MAKIDILAPDRLRDARIIIDALKISQMLYVWVIVVLLAPLGMYPPASKLRRMALGRWIMFLLRDRFLIVFGIFVWLKWGG